MWSSAPPAEGIPTDNFSAIITGFIKVPINDKFKFTLITSGAA